MRLDRAITLNLMAPLQRVGLYHPKPGIPILMYHSVSDDPEPGVHPYYRVTVSPRQFRDQMHWLKDEGYQVISLEDALQIINPTPTSAGNQEPGARTRFPLPASRSPLPVEPETRRQEPGAKPPKPGPHGAAVVTGGTPVPHPKLETRNPKPPVVLTFDDGFRDFRIAAWPVLEELNYPATVFVITGLVDQARLSFLGRELMTWEEIRELRQAGVTFGSHTATHSKLVELPPERVETELRESKLRLEDQLGEPISAFCFPYAYPQANLAFTSGLRETLRLCGYRSCLTTKIGRAHPGDDPFSLNRLPVNAADDSNLLKAKLTGTYDWLAGIQRVAKKAKLRVGRSASSRGSSEYRTPRLCTSHSEFGIQNSEFD